MPKPDQHPYLEIPLKNLAPHANNPALPKEQRDLHAALLAMAQTLKEMDLRLKRMESDLTVLKKES